MLRCFSATCRSLHVLRARLSLHALSLQACPLLEVRTIMFWTSRFCIPLLLSWDFWVRPCMHTASFLDLQGDSCDSCDPSLIHILTLWNIFWNICTASLCCSVTLGCSGTLHFLQQHFINVRLLLAMLFLDGSLGPNPGFFFMGPWVPIPGCFSFLLTSIWHVFHPLLFQRQLLPQNKAVDPSMEPAQF